MFSVIRSIILSFECELSAKNHILSKETVQPRTSYNSFDTFVLVDLLSLTGYVFVMKSPEDDSRVDL